MSAFTDHEKDLSKARHYQKYEHAYNAAFAADPDPNTRKFDELAPKDSKQWERLEIYRGNDRDAYHAHKTYPSDPNYAPTEREKKMWAYNQSKHWDIDNQPLPYIDHELSKNKWLPPMGSDKEKINAYFESIDSKYGPQYDTYAKQARGAAVSKEQYLSTMAVIESEERRSAGQQRKQEATQQQKQDTKQAQGQSADQTTAAQVADAPAQELRRSRIRTENFTVDSFTAYLEQDYSKRSNEQLREVQSAARTVMKADGANSPQEAFAQAQQYEAFRLSEAQRRAQLEEERTRVHAQGQERTRGLAR